MQIGRISEIAGVINMGNYKDLHATLSDSRYDKDMRLVRLQGYRGAEAKQALRADIGGRLAPGLCGVGSLLGVLFASPLLLGALTVTAMVGVAAPNHPIEMIYDRLTSRRGLKFPPNNAGRRLGCLIGTFMLGGATIAYLVGATALGATLGITMGLLALSVASTNLRVPSVLLTLSRGSDRTQIRSIRRALFAKTCELPTGSTSEDPSLKSS